MFWLILSDIKIVKKNLEIFLALIVLSLFVHIDFPLEVFTDIIFFSCIICILDNNILNNMLYWYLAFPRKRYFFIIQKNITIVVINIFMNFIMLMSGNNFNVLYKILFWEMISSILLMIWIKYDVIYTSSIMQLFFGILYIFAKSIEKNIGIQLNAFFLLVIIVVLNLWTTYHFTRKEIYRGIWKREYSTN